MYDWRLLFLEAPDLLGSLPNVSIAAHHLLIRAAPFSSRDGLLIILQRQQLWRVILTTSSVEQVKSESQQSQQDKSEYL